MAWEKIYRVQNQQPTPAMFEYAAGFVLAGGQSSRMGRNKALLTFSGETLVERAVRKLRQVCPAVAIAGGAPDFARYAPLVQDLEPGNGPLGGIVAALEQTTADFNLFIAVDMPVLPVAALRQLLVLAGHNTLRSSAPPLVTLASAAGQVQPLCGVYSRQALPVLRAELNKGNRRVRAAVEATGYFSYWQAPDPGWFTNVNTPEEFAAAQKLTGTEDL